MTDSQNKRGLFDDGINHAAVTHPEFPKTGKFSFQELAAFKFLKAARMIDQSSERHLSVYSYLELLQPAKDRRQQDYVHDFLSSFGFIALPLTENVGHRSLVYIEAYSLSHGLRAGDAIIAATAAENNLTLVSGNAKHFKPIKGLKLKVFKP